jgi:hypothetical protein
MLAESTAVQVDRNNMSYGAAEPFVDSSDLVLSNAVVESGYCRNTVTAATSGAQITPWLTSNTSAGGYQAYASSQYGSGQDAWNAFDGNGDTFWAAAASGMPAWVAIVLPSATKIASYAVMAPSGYPMISWYFQGSNDGSSWVNLDYRNVYVYQTLTTFSVSTDVAYRYFRIYQTSTSDGWGRLCEFRVYGVGVPAYPNSSVITLNSVPVSGAVAGKVVFRGSNQDVVGVLDLVDGLGVYPVVSGSVGSKLVFASEDLGNNIYRYTSEEFSLSGASSLGVRFGSLVASNFRLHDCLFVWR